MSRYQVTSRREGISHLIKCNTTLLIKRSFSSDDSKATSKSIGSEDEDAHRAATTLMDISSSHTSKPFDAIHVPQKARSSRKRKASEVTQANTVPIYSRFSKTPTSHRILSQHPGTVNKRNRMHQMKENEPKKYAEFLAKKRIANNLRYKKARDLLRGESSKYKPRKLKANPAKSTIKNRKWMTKMQEENPEKFQEMMERRRSASRKFWKSFSTEMKKQKVEESD